MTHRKKERETNNHQFSYKQNKQVLSNTSCTKNSIYSAFGFRISLDHATGMEAALACVMRSQQQLRWRQKGLEKQRTEFNARNITLRCEHKHRANPSQTASKNLSEGLYFTCRRGEDWKHCLASQLYLKAYLYLTFFSRKFNKKFSENKICDPTCNLYQVLTNSRIGIWL